MAAGWLLAAFADPDEDEPLADAPEQGSEEKTGQGAQVHDTPAACSYCGATEFSRTEDTGRGLRAVCDACGGAMLRTETGQWSPAGLNATDNHPRPDADPASGGVGGAANVGVDLDPNNDASVRHGSLLWDDDEPPAGNLPDARPGDPRTAAVDGPDWCGWRKASRCTFPGTKSSGGTSVAVPVDRGPCPWQTIVQQQVCPMSTPGPMATQFRTGGQHEAMPSMTHPPPEGITFHTEQLAPSHPEYQEMHNPEDPDWDHHALFAHIPEKSGVGRLMYSVTNDGRRGLHIGAMSTLRGYTRRGVASAMQDHLRSLYPQHHFDHGTRTTDGRGWWAQYQDPGRPELDVDNPAADPDDYSRHHEPKRGIALPAPPEGMRERFGYDAETTEQMGHRRFTKVPVKHGGYAGYVHSQEVDDALGNEDSQHHDGFDEDLHDETAPEPTSHEQRHHDEHGEFPDSYHDRHDEAYVEAKNARDAEEAPTHSDDELHRFVGEHGSNTSFWLKHAPVQQVSLRQPVYATQKHLLERHLNRYLTNRFDSTDHVQSRPDKQLRRYLGNETPLMVKHEGRVHAIEGHHRVAAELLRGKPLIRAHYFDADEHGFPEEDPDSYHHYRFKGERHKMEASLRIPNPLEIARLSSQDPEFGFHVTAAWKDVQAKAKRIRAGGGVHIAHASRDGLAGNVQGDHDVYDTVLVYVPGSYKIGDWKCGCKWAGYAWDRSPAYKRFEGRKCSHALAMQYEANSRGMFGKEVTPDTRVLRHVYSSLARDGLDADEDPADVIRSLMSHGASQHVAQQALLDAAGRTGAHNTRDAREHAPDFGLGVPDWGMDLVTCNQCRGSGCGACGGSGQQIKTKHGNTADPIADQNIDVGETTHDGISDVSAKQPQAPNVSGVALVAADTGRVLMLQRGMDDAKDPAAGKWEFPGGHIEDGDHTSLHGGIREWEEEVGQRFPEGGTVTHAWNSGPYQGHVVVVPGEDHVDFSDGRSTVNPDDPKGDHHEQSAWWDPDHAKKNPALRPECKSTPWHKLKSAPDDAGLKVAALLHEAGIFDRLFPGKEEEHPPEPLRGPRTKPSDWRAHPPTTIPDKTRARGCTICGGPAEVYDTHQDKAYCAQHMDDIQSGRRPITEDNPQTFNMPEIFEHHRLHPVISSSWDALHELEPYHPMQPPPHSDSENPASTGFLTGQDPYGWSQDEGMPRDLSPAGTINATLHDVPEPALPSTDGDSAEDPDEPISQQTYHQRQTSSEIADVDSELSPHGTTASVQDIVERFQSTAAAQNLGNGSGGGGDTMGFSTEEIAANARQRVAGLSKEAMADFGFAEQQELINEGKGSRARNFDQLKLEGTHYHALQSALDAIDAGEDETVIWI